MGISHYLAMTDAEIADADALLKEYKENNEGWL